MSIPFYKGIWFLPNSNLKLPGKLLVNSSEKTIRLELYGNHYLDDQPILIHDPERDKKYHSRNYNDTFQHNIPIILGKTTEALTLYNCRYFHTDDVSNEFFIIQYVIEYIFWGGHVTSTQNLAIESATFIFPYLSSWYEGEDSMEKLDHYQPPPAWGRNTAHTEEPTPITDNLRFTLSHKYNIRSKDFGIHEERQYQLYLIFQYAKPSPFSELLADANTFGKLLEFCHGKPLGKALQSIVVSSSLVEELQTRSPFGIGKYTTLRITNYTLYRDQEVAKHSQHQNYMLLSTWIMEREELNAAIRQWFANAPFNALYDFYLDTNNWLEGSGAILSNVMFNNRFLNVAQGIEAYHRKCILPTRDVKRAKAPYIREEFDKNKAAILNKLEKGSELKEWFNSHFNFKSPREVEIKLEDVLTEAIHSFADILKPLHADNEVMRFFPQYAANIRNNLSHGSHSKTDQGDALPIFFYAGQILLAIAILKTLQVSDIAYKIEHYDTFKRYLHHFDHVQFESSRPSPPTELI